MIEIIIIIPLADNDGKLFTKEEHSAFEAFTLGRFGGITKLSEVEGVWRDGGITYRDAGRFYLIAMESITEGFKLKEVTDFAKTHYRQEAIYIRYLGLAEVL